MRILHVLNHTEHLSGNVHAAVDLACAQAKAGYRVAVASRGGDFDDVLRGSGVEIFELPVTRRLVSLVKAEVELLRLVRRWRPDVIHAHMMTSAMLAFPISQTQRIPLVTSVHNAFQRSAIIMALGRRVIAVSAAVEEALSRRGFPRGRLRVVLNGTIGSARFPPHMALPSQKKELAILFVGGLHPRKGVRDLISAFALVSKKSDMGHLYLVGEGPARNEYGAMVERLGLQARITFCGSRQDSRQAMRDADIFVLPSLSDPAPLVISEAREAGCAIVASAVDGIPELLEYGQAGLLVPPSNPALLAEAIVSLVQDDRLLTEWKLRSQIGIAKLSLQRVVDEMHGVYVDAQYLPIARSASLQRGPGRLGA